MRRPAVGNGRNLYLHVGDFLSQELPPWLAAHKGVNPKAMTRRETELYHLAKTYPINSRRGYARAVVRTQLPCRIQRMTAAAERSRGLDVDGLEM
jgi:hypothetical protein